MPMQRLALLAPMPDELAPLVRRLGLVRGAPPERAIWRGTAGPIEIFAVRTGTGMQPAARAAEDILDRTPPDHLFVVGIAGGIGTQARIGDAIEPRLVHDLDTGEDLHPVHDVDGSEGRGVLVSSHRLLDPAEAQALAASRGAIAVDMETAAIGAVCARRGCPWSVYRAISDRADDGSTDPGVLDLVDGEGRARPRAVARFLLTRPQRIPQLVRLARGTGAATQRAAEAAVSAIEKLRHDA